MAAREARVAWRAASLALGSPMAAVLCGVGGAEVERGSGEDEDDRRDEEGLERDTRLSRASRDRVGGPRLRRS